MENSIKDVEIIQNDFVKLRTKVRSLNSYTKEQSILLNCLERVITTVQNNEFENLEWKARVGKGSNQIGGKLQFSNLNILRSDLNTVFKPTIENLKTIFSKQSMNLRTEVEVEGKLVTKLECTVQLKIPTQKSHLQLP